MSDAQAAPTAAQDGPVDCTEALKKLFSFLDKEIDEVDADRVRQHLADCEPCLSEYDVEDHVRALVRRSCTEHAPVDLKVRIVEKLAVLRAEVNRTDGA